MNVWLRLLVHRVADREITVNRLGSWQPPTVPIRRWLPAYDRSAIGRDLLTAAVVTALTIPQALGYAAIAGVPVQVGLYAIPVALLAYAVLGSSPHVVVGPVSTVSVVSGSLVALQAGGDPQLAVDLTIALAVVSGLILLAAGLLRLGWVAEFLSKPIISGFVFGLAVLIILGEVPTLLGVEGRSGNGVVRVIGIVEGVPGLDPTTTLIGVVSLVVLFLGARVSKSVPWGLLLVVVALLLSAQLDLASQGIATVGEVPSGLPTPGLPALPLADYAGLIIGAAGLAMVGLAESLSAGRLFATQGGYRIDADQEFVATGAANIASGLFGGLGVAGSLSKTAAVVRSGGTSQMVGLGSAALTLAVLLAFAPALSSLPRAVLAAIVVHAVWGLIDVDAIRRYAGIRRNDLVAALAAILGVLLLGTLNGLLLAVALSVLGLVYRSGRVEVEELGRIKGEKAAWGSLARHPERLRIERLMILRLNGPLFWLNATTVEDRILAHVDDAEDVEVLVLDLEATHQLDTTSADALANLLRRLQDRGVTLYLVRVMHDVRQILRRTGLTEQIGTDRMWRTISQGVRHARQSFGIEGWAPETGVEAEERVVLDLDDDRGVQRRVFWATHG